MKPRRIFLLLSLLAACERPATQLIVVVDTDYAVPSELAFVRAVVRDDGEQVRSEFSRAIGRDEIPFSFGVVPENGDADRVVIVEIEGYDRAGGERLAVRRARTGFRRGKQLLLSMFLARRCETIVCGAAETCTENGCASETVSPDGLPEVSPGNELPRRDAGVEDAGEPADAGDPDAAIDGGVLDAEPDAGVCPPAPGSPLVIGSVNVPHAIDRPLLAADVDGDGVSEVVATHGGDGTSAITVIDFDTCGRPGVVSTFVSGDLRRAPAFVEGMSGPEIWLPTRLGVEAWRYSLALGTPLERNATVLETNDLEQLAIASDGSVAGAVVRHAAWGMAHLGTTTRQERFFEQNDRPRNLAYVGETANGALFAGASPNALYFLGPGALQGNLPFSALADPVSIGPDAQFGSATAAILASRADRAIVAVRVELATMATVTSSMSFPASIVGEPMPMRVLGEARLYVLLGSEVLTWCTLSASASSVACAPASPNDGFQVEAEEDGSRTSMLSAYVDGDATPDLVVVAKEEVHFRSGVRPADAAAPSLRVTSFETEPTAPAALIPGFWTAFGASGDLLAIPYADGTVRLVSWANGANSAEALWTHVRRDALRSAHLP